MKTLPKILIGIAGISCLVMLLFILLLPLFQKQSPTITSKQHTIPVMYSRLQNPVLLQNRIFTLEALQKNFPATPADELSPEEQLIAATVSLENSGETSIDYSPYDFFVQNATGQLLAPVFAFRLTDEHMLGSGKLLPQAKKTGTIVFRVKKSEAPFLLLYKPFTIASEESVGIEITL